MKKVYIIALVIVVILVIVLSIENYTDVELNNIVDVANKNEIKSNKIEASNINSSELIKGKNVNVETITSNEINSSKANINNLTSSNANIDNITNKSITTKSLSIDNQSFYVGPAKIKLVTDVVGQTFYLESFACTCHKFKSGNNNYLMVSGIFKANNISQGNGNFIQSIDTPLGTFYASSYIANLDYPGNYNRRIPSGDMNNHYAYKDVYYGNLNYDSRHGKPVYSWRRDNQNWMMLYNRDVITFYGLVFKDKNE